MVSFWLGGSIINEENKTEILAMSDKIYDLTDLRAISRGNETFVTKMVNMFIEQTPRHLADMEGCYQQNDYKGMAAIAHKIKPSIDNMGIVSLKAVIREIEKAGKTGAIDVHIPDLLQTVVTDINKVIEGLKNEFAVVSN